MTVVRRIGGAEVQHVPGVVKAPDIQPGVQQGHHQPPGSDGGLEYGAVQVLQPGLVVGAVEQ